MEYLSRDAGYEFEGMKDLRDNFNLHRLRDDAAYESNEATCIPQRKDQEGYK